jgi:hypothetical protein
MFIVKYPLGHQPYSGEGENGVWHSNLPNDVLARRIADELNTFQHVCMAALALPEGFEVLWVGPMVWFENGSGI